jgi:purine-binding chemotaxis protein CheW
MSVTNDQMDMLASVERESVRRVLEERARQLARPVGDESTVETSSLLILALGSEQYAVDVTLVREIRPASGVTRIPGLPLFYAGLTNVRGSLLPVLDLAKYLGLDVSGAPEDEERKLVFVSAVGISVGLLVDDVREITAIPVEDLRPAVSGGGHTSEGLKVVRNVTKDLVAILDVETILRDPALEVEDAAN